MVVTSSKMLALGTPAPDFCLPDTQGNIVSLNDFKDTSAFLVIFMCNHCPFVRHVLEGMLKVAKEYQERGVGVVGINSNDVANFPEDSPEMMAAIAGTKGFTFPYLYDETQQVAKEYQATCTPDFFLFDKEKRLVYRGQMDDSRPGNDTPITGVDLKGAMDAVLVSRAVSAQQKPSIGCNIKWKQGNEPEYAK